MATSITIALDGVPAPIVFPQRCVGCGGARSTESTLAFAKVVTNARGTQAPVHVKLAVPHCEVCSRSTKAVFLAGLVPFVLGFLAAGGAAFAVVAYGVAAAGLDEVGRLNNANSLVLGAAAGLAAGIAGGFVLELVARVVLLAVFGLALLRAPLLVPALFTDTDYVAGVTGRPNGDLSAVTVTFALDDIAREFEEANTSRLHALPRG